MLYIQVVIINVKFSVINLIMLFQHSLSEILEDNLMTDKHL